MLEGNFYYHSATSKNYQINFYAILSGVAVSYHGNMKSSHGVGGRGSSLDQKREELLSINTDPHIMLTRGDALIPPQLFFTR